LNIRLLTLLLSRFTSDVLRLVITYSAEYPDEIPEIEIETEEGEISEEEEEQLVMEMITAVRPSTFYRPVTSDLFHQNDRPMNR
jgi:hypothetical protein